MSVAEAAVITAGLLEIKTDGATAAWCDDGGVPAWASAGFGTMKAAGFVGTVPASGARSGLDRRTCAVLMAAIMRYSAAKK